MPYFRVLLVLLSLSVSSALHAQGKSTEASEERPEKLSVFYEHLRKGKTLLEDDQLKPALLEFEAAHASADKPVTAYYIARIHHRLGDRVRALSFYQKYLREASALEPERKVQVEKYVQELSDSSAGAPPPPVPELPPFQGSGPAQPPPVPELPPFQGSTPNLPGARNRGLLAAGAAVLGTSYVACAIVGMVGVANTYDAMGAIRSGRMVLPGGRVIEEGNAMVPGYPSVPMDTLRNASGSLMVPILGPFISAGLMPTASWAAPVILLGGGSQLAGLAMTIAGAIKRKLPARAAFLPYAGAQGVGFVVAGRF